jgi:hypothetical protein
MSIPAISGIDIFLRPLSEKFLLKASEISAMILKLKLFSTKKSKDSGFRIQNSEFRIQDSGFAVS